MKKIINIAFICFLLFHLQTAQANSSSDSAKVDTTDLLKSLDMKVVPDIATLYKVGKKYIGKWNYLFLAIKIEESGNNGKYSWLSTTHFNLCGMRYPKQRKTYAIGKTNTNYAIYRNWFESILDFKIYLDNIDKSFFEQYKREAKDEYEMVDFLFSKFNHFAKWKTDMYSILKQVKKKYK